MSGLPWTYRRDGGGKAIDCHRKTELNTKGNDYYTKLVELHEASDKEALKVEDIGGLECAKCHY